jgi:hypothetical protein
MDLSGLKTFIQKTAVADAGLSDFALFSLPFLVKKRARQP